MSRTTLCGITAAGLALLSLAVMGLRYHALGHEVKLPVGPDTWKVTLTVQGVAEGDARILTATPLDFNRQHVLRETFKSTQMFDKPPDVRNPLRRRVWWARRPGVGDGPFKLRCDFCCAIGLDRPTAPMTQLGEKLYAPPARGSYLDVESKNGTDHERISNLARQLTAGVTKPADQAHALFRHVDGEIANEPAVGHSSSDAARCLEDRCGDAGAKSRLLVALLRNRGSPSRMVLGLALTKGPRQVAHYWVESWLHDLWVPMCPSYHHYGKVPSTYLVFAFGDLLMVRGRNVRDLDYAFLVERFHADDEEVAASESPLRHFFRSVSLYMLPPAEQRLVEFLLLMPVAALIICVFRNVIGLNSFGTFAPALLGLAFRDLCSLPGVLVFASILLVGWVMRRLLDRYHLLQVPRVSVMLTLVVLLLVSFILAANHYAMPATRYFSLFPLVILTGLIERFWTLEQEDGTLSSFRTLLYTLLIAATVAVVLSFPAICRQLFRFPETLGLVMALQLLIGRYTGYRLTELFRFRDFLQAPPPPPEGPRLAGIE